MPLSSRELTLVHRRQQLALRQATVRDVTRLWPALDWVKVDATYPRFAQSVAGVVARNRRTSMGLSAAYVRAFRVSSGLPGDLQIVMPDELPVEQFSTALRVTSVVAIKSAAVAGIVSSKAMANALTLASGSMARLTLDAGRETVVETVRADPRALGWQRILGGGGCEFCRMLAGRGAVYKESTVGFEAHDRCGCTSEPVYA